MRPHAATATVPPLVALQRTIGNRAMGRLLRAPAPSAAPTASTALTRLDDLLYRFTVPEEEVIRLVHSLSAEEKRSVVTGTLLQRMSAALKAGAMARAIAAFDIPLDARLEWIRRAARNWTSIDYSDIAGLIRQASEAERHAFGTGAWRDRFVDISGGPDTMLRAARDLRFELRTKLEWMLAEGGTNAEWIMRAIRESPRADHAAVTADATLMDRLRRTAGGEWPTVDRMLRSDLLGERSIVTEVHHAPLTQHLALRRDGLWITKQVNFVEAGKFGPGGFDAMRTRMIDAISTYLDGKFKVRVASADGREGDGDYPVRVKLLHNPRSKYPVYLRGGSAMRSWVGTDRADIGELTTVTLPFGMARVALPGFASMLAHEAAHLLLGAQDEYHDHGRVKKEYTDNSLMAEDRNANAEIKARHLEHLVQYVAAMFPDRTVSIVE